MESDNLSIVIPFNGNLQFHTQDLQIEIVGTKEYAHQCRLIGQFTRQQVIAVFVVSMGQLWKPCSLFAIQFTA